MLDNPTETEGKCDLCPQEAKSLAVAEISNINMCLSHICSTYSIPEAGAIAWLSGVGINVRTILELTT